MELSVQIETFDLTWDRWRRIVADAERLGYAGLYVCDHFASPDGARAPGGRQPRRLDGAHLPRRPQPAAALRAARLAAELPRPGGARPAGPRPGRPERRPLRARRRGRLGGAGAPDVRLAPRRPRASAGPPGRGPGGHHPAHPLPGAGRLRGGVLHAAGRPPPARPDAPRAARSCCSAAPAGPARSPWRRATPTSSTPPAAAPTGSRRSTGGSTPASPRGAGLGGGQAHRDGLRLRLARRRRARAPAPHVADAPEPRAARPSGSSPRPGGPAGTSSARPTRWSSSSRRGPPSASRSS